MEMISRAEIESKGSQWLASFPKLGFVGEIPINESEIEAWCASLWKYSGYYYRDERIRAALAVTVVNLAYYLPEEINSGGFREFVLDKFGCPYDFGVWDSAIGPTVLRVFIDYFGEVEVYGPFKYVSPIMRQAGVPAKLVKKFSVFFRDLINRYGWSFSRQQFSSFHSVNQLSSNTLNSFLGTRQGVEFCQDLARSLARVKAEGLPQSTLSTLPGFRPTLIKKVWEQVSALPQPKVFPTEPKLVLDVERGRLAIDFSADWLKKGAYLWETQEPVRHSRYLLRKSDLVHSTLDFILKATSNSIESFELNLWSPIVSAWAVFRFSNGEVVTWQDEIAEGRYLVVVPESVELPSDSIIEDHGYLELFGIGDGEWRILECQLPARFSVPQIGFKVGIGSTFPALRFLKNTKLLQNSFNVFLGQIPDIEIFAWQPDFERNYLIQINLGSGWKTISKDWFLTPTSIRLQLEGPVQGRVRIEPIGRVPRGFISSDLSFVLLPSFYSIKWPFGLKHATEQVWVECSPPSEISVKWDSQKMEHIRNGVWQVPPFLSQVEGWVTCQNSTVFSISGIVHWFQIECQIVQEGVFWANQMHRRSSFLISLSPNEHRQTIELGILAMNKFYSLGQFGPVSKKGKLELTTDSIRDAVETHNLAAGHFCVRLQSGKGLLSQFMYMNEARIPTLFWEGSDEERKGFFRMLPKMYQPWFAFAESLRHSPEPSFLPPGSPPHLKDFFEPLVCGWRVFDQDDFSSFVRTSIPKPLEDVCLWYQQAQGLGELDQVNPDEIRKHLNVCPDFATVLPLTRWRQKIEQQLAKLQSVPSIDNVFHEWSMLCQNRKWKKAMKTRLAAMNGGELLTQACEDYFWGLEHKSRQQTGTANQYFASTHGYLQEIFDQTKSGIIWEIAQALRIMVFYHLEHPEFSQVAQGTLPQLPDQWAKFRFTVSQLLQQKFPQPTKSSYGLSDFSPHPIDVELEQSCYAQSRQ